MSYRVYYDKYQELQHQYKISRNVMSLIPLEDRRRMSTNELKVAKERLMERFSFDDVQADAIVKMRLGQRSGAVVTGGKQESGKKKGKQGQNTKSAFHNVLLFIYKYSLKYILMLTLYQKHNK